MIFYKIDTAFNTNIFRNMSIVWFYVWEGASIIENSLKLGVELPERTF